MRAGSARRSGGPAAPAAVLAGSSMGSAQVGASGLPVTTQGCSPGPSARGGLVPEQGGGWVGRHTGQGWAYLSFTFTFRCPVSEIHEGMLVIKLTFVSIELELPEAVEGGLCLLWFQ